MRPEEKEFKIIQTSRKLSSISEEEEKLKSRLASYRQGKLKIGATVSEGYGSTSVGSRHQKDILIYYAKLMRERLIEIESERNSLLNQINLK